MQILDFRSHIIPLSTSYQGDTDVKFIGLLDTTEEGLRFYRENYLNGAVDTKINNYSSLYLTDKKKLEDIIRIERLPELTEYKKINSSIIDNNTGLYMTLSSSEVDGNTQQPVFTIKDEKFIDPAERIFEITIFNGSSAKIAHKNKNRNYYYLSIDDNANLTFSL